MATSAFFSRYRAAISLVAIAVFSVIAIATEMPSSPWHPQTAGLMVLSGVQAGFSAVGKAITRTFDAIRELTRLREDYALLLERVRRFELAESDLTVLVDENKRLRDALEFAQRDNFQNLAAEVIGKDPGNLFDTLTVDKGSAHGVRVNSPAIAFQSGRRGLVGRVVDVAPYSAIVQPLTDTNAYVGARLLESRFDGLVNGTGAGMALMRYVERNARSSISVGDMVVTSGLGGRFPAGIAVGTVESVLARPYDTSLELMLRPVVDFSRLEVVFLLIGSF